MTDHTRFATLLILGLSGLAVPAYAQSIPVPGMAEGQVDGQPFSFPLDCSSWDAQQQQVFSAGDNRGNSDDSGDGLRFTFSHFAPASSTSGTLWIDDRELAINSGFRPGPDAPKWEVTETGASFEGPTFGVDSAEIAITIDCAPRAASERGFTGTVIGTIDGRDVNAPLFCGAWDQPDAISARTEEESDIAIDLFVIRASGQGSIEVDAGDETYQMVAAPIAGTEFEITEDSVRFAEDLTNRRSGRSYSVDLTFDCTDR